MTLYHIIRHSERGIEHYYPHTASHFDNWTSTPEVHIWNTSLTAIALHIAAVERERERIMGTNRKIEIIGTRNGQSFVVNEEQYAYAGHV